MRNEEHVAFKNTAPGMGAPHFICSGLQISSFFFFNSLSVHLVSCLVTPLFPHRGLLQLIGWQDIISKKEIASYNYIEKGIL